MADIQTYLELIKNAVYGKDVRQAIHDGIELCYEDASSGIDVVARAEVTDAREGADGTSYSSLGEANRTQFSELNGALEYTNKNLPWFNTFPESIFSHGEVLYGTGEWSDTVTRWGTRDLQYADEDMYVSINQYTPELSYNVCYFDSSGNYRSWSTWQHYDDGEYKIPKGSYYKLTISRRADSSEKATIDFIYQLVINTGLKQLASANDKFKLVNNGIRFDPILVGGYTSNTAIRTSTTLDLRRRYKAMLKPKYIYEGSYIYCDTAMKYRMRIVKRDTEESESGTVVVDNIPVPTQDAPYIFSEGGYYTIHFMDYDGASEVVLNDLYGHVTFGLYSDTPNSIFVDFIGGGRTFEGPADATLFIGEHGTSLLIDGVYPDMQGNLFNEFHNVGIDHLDYVMISHFHRDHFGGLTILYDNNNMSADDTTFILPSEEGVEYALEHLPDEINYTWFNRFNAVLTNADCTIIRPQNGDVQNIGGMTVTYWNADHSIYEGVSTNYNDWSLCCYITYGTQRICMSGDLGPIGQRLNTGKMLKSNIYKSHHHGWDGTSAPEDVMGMKRYMSEIMPEIIISLDGGTHDELYLLDTSPLIPWCEANAIPHYRAHENSPIQIELTKESFKILTSAKRYTREEASGN